MNNNKNNREAPNINLYFLIIILLLAFTAWVGTLRPQGETWTMGQLEKALDTENVADAVITPNA